MFQLRRRGQVVYEDLLREMEAIEQQLLTENSSLAMNLMVLEAKIRERFHKMEAQGQENGAAQEFLGEEFSLDEIQALVPRELPLLPSMERIGARRRRKRTLETVGMAAVLALGTALGVFGLASILQLALSWVA